MNIVIAAEGEGEEARVSPQAARATHFLLFDGEGKFIKELENPFADVRGGAGFSAAKFLAEEGVEVFVAERIGENMARELERLGIRGYEGGGLAREVAKQAAETEE